MADNRATATGGMPTVDLNNDPVLSASQDLVGPPTVQLLVDHSLLNTLSGCGNQLGSRSSVESPARSPRIAYWRKTSPSS